jgi:hypothetical protein
VVHGGRAGAPGGPAGPVPDPHHHGTLVSQSGGTQAAAVLCQVVLAHMVQNHVGLTNSPATTKCSLPCAAHHVLTTSTRWGQPGNVNPLIFKHQLDLSLSDMLLILAPPIMFDTLPHRSCVMAEP